MSENKHDRRTQRTRQLLYTAFVELLQEQHYDDITVQDIVGRANLGRSTFYAHFTDKDDLLVQSFERVLDMLINTLGSEAPTGQIINSRALFEHIQSHQIFYRALLHSRGLEIILRNGQLHIAQIVEHRLKGRLRADQESIPLPIMAHMVAGALFVLIRWWLDNKMPYSPEDMDRIFQQFVSTGIQ